MAGKVGCQSFRLTAFSLLAWLAVSVQGPGASAQPAASRPSDPAGAARVVLDQGCYWRCYYRYGGEKLSATLLESEGAKFLTPREVKQFQAFAKQNRPVFMYDGPDWSIWDNGPPPGDWASADFDAAAWPRCRRPEFMGPDWPTGPMAQTACFRGTFAVPDPAACGPFSLTLSYRGGVRVLLNGKEITRAHLPPGELAADAPGEDYPLEAYIVLEDEFSPDFVKKTKYALWPEVGDPKDFDKWEPAGGANDRKAGLKRVGNHCPAAGRKVFERLKQARDRRLGPVALPAELLRKGRNVLAVELRTTRYHPAIFAVGGDNGRPFVNPWLHGAVKGLELVCAAGDVPVATSRPAGVQVWVEDIHQRVFSTEYHEPGSAMGTLRIVAARNGTHAGQIVVGTDAGLSGLKVSPGDLKAEGGAGAIPASAVSVSVMVGHPANELLAMGMDDYDHKPDYQTWYAVRRHAPECLTGGRGINWAKAQHLRFFDHLGGAGGAAVTTRPAEAGGTPVPPTVPPDSCQPLWISLKVPADAKPGLYRGQLTVQAQGLAGVPVPMEVEVVDWRVPDARDFATVVAAEQSPYGLARQYKVPPWSDRHFELMEASFRQLARLGNDWLFVPVLSNGEFGNHKDSPVKWTRKKDGGLTFDYAAMDRYIDLAVKTWGAPKVIAFDVVHGNPCAESEVEVFDEATGKTAAFNLGVDHLEDTPTVDQEHKQVWKAFAESLYEHMKGLPNGEKSPLGTPAKGLAKSMYWGYSWDADANKDLMKFLREVTPEVYWTRGAHFAGISDYYRAVSTCYGFRGDGLMRAKGWKTPTLWLQNSRRGWFDCFVGCAGVDTPFLFRNWPEQTLTFGQRGLARIGGDYWGIWRDGCEVLNMAKARGRTKGTVGFAINSILWPGADGAESSARLECLIEGLQEAEARVFLERAIDAGPNPTTGVGEPRGKSLPANLAERAKNLLAGRARATALVISSSGGFQADHCWQGWQDRSRELYRLAAEAAKALDGK